MPVTYRNLEVQTVRVALIKRPTITYVYSHTKYMSNKCWKFIAHTMRRLFYSKCNIESLEQ